MAETVIEVMPPLPPDPLHEYLKVVGMSAAGATLFMGSHKLVTIEYMLLFFPKRSPRPQEYLQRAEKPPDQKVRDGCPEEGSSLHLLGEWLPTKEGADHIHLMDTVTTHVECAGNIGWGKLRQSWPSWDQGGKYWCWMVMVWLKRSFCHKYGWYNRCWFITP